MVSRVTAIHMAFAALAAGVVLVVLGAVRIEGARYLAHQYYPVGPAIDGVIFYHTWNELELVAGIVLAVAGTALVATSLTYLILTGKREGSGSRARNPEAAKNP